MTRPPIRRILWAMSRLRSGRPLKAADLAREFETSLRTAYRDIEFLQDQMGAPLEFDRSRKSYVLNEPTWAFPLASLSQGELIALFFAEKVLAQYRGTPYEADLRSAFKKIQELLPEEVDVDPTFLEEIVSLDLGPVVAPDPGIFRAVVGALLRHRRISIRYTSLSRGRTGDRSVDPYRIYNLHGIWYLAAWDPGHEAVRDFALHRIEAVRELEAVYRIASGFNFKKYLADAFNIEKGRRPVWVSIRFAERQARWIRERKWHPTARIQNRLDGGCVLRMRVAGLGEVKRWVLQFGSEAEVLAPKGLRAEVLRELSGAEGNYRASGSLRKGRPT